MRFIHNLHLRFAAASLGGGALLGGLVLATGLRQAWPHPWVAAIVTGVLFAGFVAGVIRYGWNRKGGWVDSQQVDDWVRNRRLPDDVPLGEALSRLTSRIDRVQMALWSNAGLLLLMSAQLALGVPDGEFLGTALRVAICAFFAAALAWSIYARVRLVPVMNELILQGRRRFAGGLGTAA